MRSGYTRGVIFCVYPWIQCLFAGTHPYRFSGFVWPENIWKIKYNSSHFTRTIYRKATLNTLIIFINKDSSRNSRSWGLCGKPRKLLIDVKKTAGLCCGDIKGKVKVLHRRQRQKSIPQVCRQGWEQGVGITGVHSAQSTVNSFLFLL